MNVLAKALEPDSVGISIERWAGAGEIKVYLDAFNRSPKLLVVSNSIGQRTIEGFATEVVSPEWFETSKDCEIRAVLGGPYEALVIDDCAMRGSPADDGSRNKVDRFIEKLILLAWPRRVFLTRDNRDTRWSLETLNNEIEDPSIRYKSLSREISAALADECFVEAPPIVEDEIRVSSCLEPIEESKPMRFPTSRTQFRLAVTSFVGETFAFKDALISLKITEGNDRLEEKIIRNSGLGLSPDPEIGLYRYLDLEPGYTINRLQFDLPDGVECGGVEFRRFGENRSEILLGNVHLDHADRYQR